MKKRQQPKERQQPALPGPVLRRPEAMAFTGLRTTQFDDYVRDGILPQPIKITPGGRTCVWLRSELEAYIAERVKARDAKQKVQAD